MQRYRAAILIVLFGVLPVAAAFGVALMYLGNNPPPAAETKPASEEPRPAPAAPPKTRDVLGAARALPVGTLLGEDDLSALTLEADAVRGTHVVIGKGGVEAAADKLRGYALREALGPGEPLVRSDVVGPGQSGFLAAVLRPGMRAVTIQVGPATGHAGLIDPGDRVDVILTAELPDSDVDQVARATLGVVLARTILEDVRVVAVDRRTDSAAGSPEGGEEVQRTKIITATLEVSPMQGDRLVLGGHEGKLSLAVRSLTDAAPPPSSVAVDLHELLLPAGADPLAALPEPEPEPEPLPPPPPPAPVEAETEPVQAVVRVFRGSEPAEELLFERQR